jgi:hypothetical protein
MRRRDRQQLYLLAAVSAGVAASTFFGVHSDVLLALPALLLSLPLLAGRYLGEEQLARLAAGFVSARRRRSAVSTMCVRAARRTLPRGGRLIAASLAVRPPPALCVCA